MVQGEANRVIGEHQLNLESSRSHSIFGVTLEIEPSEGAADGNAGKRIVSKINLVDLAGSERVSKTRSEGLVLREAGHINKSLHILEQVGQAGVVRSTNCNVSNAAMQKTSKVQSVLCVQGCHSMQAASYCTCTCAKSKQAKHPKRLGWHSASSVDPTSLAVCGAGCACHE